MVAPNTPVVVGVGQYKQQLSDPTAALEQSDLMAEALLLAGADGGAPAVLDAIERLVVIGGMWSYPDPGRLVADRVGASSARSYLTAMGGDMPQVCVADAAERIGAGECDVVAIVGGEAVYSKNKLRALGKTLPRSGQDMQPAEFFGENVTMSSDHEERMGFGTPTAVYPLFESAVRAHAARPVGNHRRYLGELWSDFNRVATMNPHAWVRTPMSAEEIVTPSPSNRMVGLPYTKAMNANSFVDFGGAILLCSAERADSLGVPRDRWVFLHGAAKGHASYLFSERENYFSSPAIRRTGELALELSETDIDDVAHMDLYSCFPSVVQISMAELGIEQGRRVTTTGGLPFFGGPMNSYVIHAIASTVDALRADEGSYGFVHANGGYATKHACAVYSTSPPDTPFRFGDAQELIDRYPTRAVDELPSGPAVTETLTVLHDR
ncbi:MAG: acetyl-CoA acetyltransferase, partial [Acidimicrobiales bacterium]